MYVSRKPVSTAFFLGLFFMGQMFMFWPVVAEGVPSSPSSSFQFIYVDANVGGSSGGHSALRIGNTVYHFQYFSDGFFKLVRDRWSYFRYVYNDLENRTLYVAHIQVDDHDLQTLQEYLDRHYLIQKAHLARLDQLLADTTLLNNLSLGYFQMSVNGAGLFSAESRPDDISAQLRLVVSKAYGTDYLIGAMEALDRDLLQRPLVVPELTPTDIRSDTYPPRIESFAGNYAENRSKRTALNVLEQALPVQENCLTDIGHLARPSDPKGLTANERKKLSAYAETLKLSVIQLIQSSRPDWGYPLLLANARYQAIMRSLEKNSLYLLDPFPDSAKSVSTKTEQEDHTVTAKLADRARITYWDIRQKTFAEGSLNERLYNRLEESAGRFVELENGRLTGNNPRIAYSRLIPARSGMVPLPAPNFSSQTLTRLLHRSRLNQHIYIEKLKHCYLYNLIENNCATELIRITNAPFKSQGRVIEALGGRILPEEDFAFIPFHLFGLVEARFRVTEVEVLPGYRQRVLQRAAQIDPENASLLYFRECNTLTATLYNNVGGESPFLFFTDDVVWIRPVYGALNGVYGLITAALGIFTLPVDGGDLSLAGLKGAMYSLPELFFFNIRKGSYNYIDDQANFEIER